MPGVQDEDLGADADAAGVLMRRDGMDRPAGGAVLAEPRIWWEEQLPRIFPEEELGKLAGRVLRILMFASLLPGPRWISAREMTGILGAARTRPAREPDIAAVSEVMERLASRGRCVLRRRCEGPPADDGYRIGPEPPGGDPGTFSHVEPRSALAGRPHELERVAMEVAVSPELPLARLARSAGEPIQLVWQHTARRGRVLLARAGELDPERIEALSRELAMAETDFLLIIRPPVVQVDGSERPGVWPIELALLPVAVWCPRPLADPALVVELARCPELLRQEHGEERVRLAEQVREAYREGEVAGPAGIAGIPDGAGREPFDRWLERVAHALLEHRFPRHFIVSPGPADLSRNALSGAVELFLRPARPLAPARLPFPVRSVVEGYLGALGLVSRTGRQLALDVAPERSEVARHVLDAAGAHPLSVVDLYLKLRKGPLGLTRPCFDVVLLSLIFAGRMVPLGNAEPVPVERVSAGTLGRLSAVVRERPLPADVGSQLAALRFLFSHRERRQGAPHSPGQLWDEVRALRNRNLLELGGLAARVRRARLEPALAHLPLCEAEPWLDRLGEQLRELDASLPAQEGLAALHRALARAGLLEQLGLMQRLLVFLEHAARRHLACWVYLSQPELIIAPEGRFTALAVALASLRDRSERPETCLDRQVAKEMQADFEAFHVAYREAYWLDHQAISDVTGCTRLGPARLEWHAACVCGRRLGDLPARGERS